MPKPKSKRKHYTADQKAAIVRRHLVDKVPVSQICEEAGIPPSVFYTWQKQLFDHAQTAFAPPDGRARRADAGELARAQRRVAELEAKLSRKDSVIAQLTEELIAEKKIGGGK